MIDIIVRMILCRTIRGVCMMYSFPQAVCSWTTNRALYLPVGVPDYLIARINRPSNILASVGISDIFKISIAPLSRSPSIFSLTASLIALKGYRAYDFCTISEISLVSSRYIR